VQSEAVRLRGSWFPESTSIRPAISLLAGKAQPTAGSSLAGGTTQTSGGFSLIETDSPEAASAFNAEWSDVLDLHMYPVIEDAR
jgi:hypothetical protein